VALRQRPSGYHRRHAASPRAPCPTRSSRCGGSARLREPRTASCCAAPDVGPCRPLPDGPGDRPRRLRHGKQRHPRAALRSRAARFASRGRARRREAARGTLGEVWSGAGGEARSGAGCGDRGGAGGASPVRPGAGRPAPARGGLPCVVVRRFHLAALRSLYNDSSPSPPRAAPPPASSRCRCASPPSAGARSRARKRWGPLSRRQAREGESVTRDDGAVAQGHRGPSEPAGPWAGRCGASWQSAPRPRTRRT